MIRTLVRVKLLVPAGLGLVLALAAVVVVGAIAARQRPSRTHRAARI